jgi:hypothetical protein
MYSLDNMSRSQPAKSSNDVESGILRDFIQRLGSDELIDRATVERLVDALLVRHEVSADELRSALFPEE